MKRLMKTDYSQILREQIFPRVQKPARYMGGEWNQICKEIHEGLCRIVLAFPDVYEIGAVYLGFQILYEILNQNPEVYVERVYSPWTDMEKLLRENNIPLCSLETGTPLSGFDILGITLQHEMAYTNILNLLDLGGIPLPRKERSEDQPLILGGGPGAANPEPIAEIFDLIILGDGESVFPEIIRQNQKMRGQSRQTRIRELSRLGGVYAPGLYHPVYSPEGRLLGIEAEPDAPFPVRRRFEPIPELPTKPLVPYVAITHDRISVELFRGCTRGCRFCQAGMINRPVRERDPQAVFDQLMKAVEATGYEEVSFTALSSGDYTQLQPLVDRLMQELIPRRIALSLPSLRLDSFNSEVAESIGKVRKTGLTFAPEAGSDDLRQSINKYMDEQAFIANLARIFVQGWERLKLYFMLGLPGERTEDITAISVLVRKILAEACRATPGRKRALRLNLSLALFVPKPHTPFQWEGQLNRSEVKLRYKQLARELPPAAGYRFGKAEEQELNKSYLEAVMARGDRRLWEVVHQAWARGARFDSWSEHFNFELWSQIFVEKGIDPDEYALRERGVEEVMPWDHLDTGVSRDFLKQEKTRAQAARLTPDCRPANCQGCGVADPKTCPPPPARELAPAGIRKKVEPGPERESVRIRLRYKKTGDMRFVGHLDMVNLFRRAARRAHLPLHYSIGFHPQPALAFGPPLTLGFQGLAEWLDIGLDSWLDPGAIVQAMNLVLPPGIRLEVGREIPLNTPALSKRIDAGRYILNLPEAGETRKFKERISQILESKEILISQWSKRGTIRLDLRPAIVDLRWRENQGSPSIELAHRTVPQGTGKVSAIAAYLCQDQVEAWKVQVIRTASGYWHQGKIMIP